MGKRAVRVGLAAASLVVAALAFSGGLAFAANVTSYQKVIWGPAFTDSGERCATGESLLYDFRDGKSHVYSYLTDNGYCSRAGYTPVQRPPGWLGATADLYENGSLCGITNWYYSADWQSSFGGSTR